MPLFGLEGDVGNLGLNGIARSHAPFVSGGKSSRTEADFYLTARGRLGFVADHWLFYGTCGYFGAETRVAVIDACFIAPPCGHSTMDAPRNLADSPAESYGIPIIVRSESNLPSTRVADDCKSTMSIAISFTPPLPFYPATSRTRETGAVR